MADTRTAVSEIVTGLGLFGFRDLGRAIAARPRFITNVDDTVFDELEEAFASALTDVFGWPGPTVSASPLTETASAAAPLVGGVERPHKPPAYEQIPADLRVDHVYLLSCKYGSKILQNASPRTSSTGRSVSGEPLPWIGSMPSLPRRMASSTPRSWRTPVSPASARPHRTDRNIANDSGRRCPAVGRPNSASSGGSWRSRSPGQCRSLLDNISAKGEREAFVWRLLRLQAAPYFVLGADLKNVPLHYRVTTPWDFRTLRAPIG